MSAVACEYWQVADWLPCGRSGAWEVRRRVGSESTTELIERVEGGELLWMDDAPREWEVHQAIRDAAHGDVLLYGLGIGMLPAWLARQERIESITIIENSPDVMRLVEPYVMSTAGTRKGIRVIHADANKWEATGGERYDVAWVDHTLAPMTAAERRAWAERVARWAGSVLFWEPL